MYCICTYICNCIVLYLVYCICIVNLYAIVLHISKRLPGSAFIHSSVLLPLKPLPSPLCSLVLGLGWVQHVTGQVSGGDCYRMYGEWEESAMQKKISDDRQHCDKWTAWRNEKEGWEEGRVENAEFAVKNLPLGRTLWLIGRMYLKIVAYTQKKSLEILLESYLK